MTIDIEKNMQHAKSLRSLLSLAPSSLFGLFRTIVYVSRSPSYDEVIIVYIIVPVVVAYRLT
jgi:hypothetical protein